MLFQQLESFVTVASVLNVSRAAELLNVSQPTLTARLKNLEGAVGQRLLIRTKTGVRLSEAGQMFMLYAERALAAVGEGRQAMLDMSRGDAGQLTVAGTFITNTYLLPPALVAFAASHTTARLTLRTALSQEIPALVESETVHLGIVRDLHPPELEATPLLREEIVVVTGPGHPLARRAAVTAQDVALQTHVVFRRRTTLEDLTTRIFREAGVAPHDSVRVDNIEAAKNIVEAGLGVVVLPTSAVRRDLERGTLRRLDVVDIPPVVSTIYGIQRRGACAKTPLAQTLLNLLRELPVTR